MSTKLVTGEVRASYVNVFEKRVNEADGKSAYSMMLLVPKSDTATVAAIKAACAEAITNQYGTKKPTGKFRDDPLRDGDDERPDLPEYKNCWFINTKSTMVKPKVVKAMGGKWVELEHSEDFTSGDYCKVSLNAYTYKGKSNGVTLGLGNIMFTKGGDPLGASTRPEDDFGEAPASDGLGDQEFPFQGTGEIY